MTGPHEEMLILKSPHDVERTIEDLRKLHELTTQGQWRCGQSSHETVSHAAGREDSHVAEFRHANDATFCDAAHNALPALLETLTHTREVIKERDAEVAALKDAAVQAESRAREQLKMLGRVIQDLTVGNQSAWIEWQHGGGAEAAMTWVHNGLAGPGLIPGDAEPYATEAQAWYDANNSDPLPKCHCGRPSNIGWMGHGFCSQAHYVAVKGAA